jgi:hypothetical protein
MTEHQVIGMKYSPQTGLIYSKRGVPVRTKDTRGYLVASIKHKTVKQHRIAFYMMFKRWPKQIDHVNRIKTDNRICNLREVSSRENCWNRQVSEGRDPCITFLARKDVQKQWQVLVKYNENGKTLRYHKCFDTKEEAIYARDSFLKTRDDWNGRI